MRQESCVVRTAAESPSGCSAATVTSCRGAEAVSGVGCMYCTDENTALRLGRTPLTTQQHPFSLFVVHSDPR